ncbi:hypothetical protein PVAP13_2KG346900 [Panicum virgatum]|uniref:Bifunctional inhibitor/plant lipid transfer protein/seed storage helical domain-containing protein n=1 Tax=Panicum virgatum TaxID=38727 RepID=A0A8T0WCL0_PANVG|nr:hypothetical protein PVAP13_2KG346900 [Panicum virgatum]
MKEMIVILAFIDLIVSASSMQMGTCSCGQQGHEQHQQQENHPQQQQQQQQQQQLYHQQKHHGQSKQQHREPPQQQHHQQYQGQQCHEKPQLQQQPCQYGYNYYSGSQNLNNCREFLRQQCNPLAMPFLQSRLLPPSSCQVLRQQCCQELKQIELGYLHQAINSMVQSLTYHQQKQEEKQQSYGFYGPQHASQNEVAILMAAQYLPSMCGMYHSYVQNNSCHKDASGARY